MTGSKIWENPRYLYPNTRNDGHHHRNYNILGVADLVLALGPLSHEAYQDTWAERGAPAKSHRLPMPFPYIHREGTAI